MRIPDTLRECVVFLCVRTGSPDRPQYLYGGTAFWVSVPCTRVPGRGFRYLVTARHCVEKAASEGDLYARVNTSNGGHEFVRLTREWMFPDEGASDVAVMPFELSPDQYALKCIEQSMFATPTVIQEKNIGIGDELVVAGLFTQHQGTQRNLPIVRSGILAAMPEEPLEAESSGLMYDAYLAEVRSIGGLSGSPVFVYLSATRIPGQFELGLGSRLLLLGVIRGHWDHKRSNGDLDYAHDELDQVNMGIAIVTPIQDVLDIINREDMVRNRRHEEAAYLKQAAQSSEGRT